MSKRRTASPTDRSNAPSAAGPRKALKTSGRKAEPPLQQDDDATLLGCVTGMLDRNQEALGRLYDATAGRIYGVALRIVRQPDLAEEVVSDTYYQAWRDCARYDAARGKVLAWLLIICRSRALDALRRRDEAMTHPDPHELAEEPSDRENPQDLLSAVQENATLHAALVELSPLQRQLVALAFFRGYSHSEIEQHTGIPLGSVKTHIRKALAILRGALGDTALPKK